MGVWDATTPAGSDLLSQGDDRIRELKAALEEALSHELSTFPGNTPGSTPIFIPGFLRDTTANRPAGDSLVVGRLYINTTLGVIERYNGSTWDAVAGGVGIQSGTTMLFYQSAAPTGWTAVAVNDKFLRVVSAGGSGGSTGGSGAKPSSTIFLEHTHTVASHTHDLANHTHSTPAHQHDFELDGSLGSATGNFVYADSTSGGPLIGAGGTDVSSSSAAKVHNRTANSGSGTSGTPSSNTSGSSAPTTDLQLTNFTFQYADVIVASKD